MTARQAKFEKVEVKFICLALFQASQVGGTNCITCTMAHSSARLQWWQITSNMC